MKKASSLQHLSPLFSTEKKLSSRLLTGQPAAVRDPDAVRQSSAPVLSNVVTTVPERDYNAYVSSNGPRNSGSRTPGSSRDGPGNPGPVVFLEKRIERLQRCVFQNTTDGSRQYNKTYLYSDWESHGPSPEEAEEYRTLIREYTFMRFDKRGSPLLIFHMDGVIADYTKLQIYAEVIPSLYVPTQLKAALSNLARYFRIALCTRKPLKGVRKLLEYLALPDPSVGDPGFRFDRVYARWQLQSIYEIDLGLRKDSSHAEGSSSSKLDDLDDYFPQLEEGSSPAGHSGDPTAPSMPVRGMSSRRKRREKGRPLRLLVPHIQNYGRVYEDFDISLENVSRDVLVIGALNLEYDEVETRSGDDLLRDHSGGVTPYFSTCTPFLCASNIDRRLSDSSIPVQLLLPNPLAQNRFESVSMMYSAKLIKEMFMVGVGNFEHGWNEIKKAEMKKLKSTVHSEYLMSGGDDSMEPESRETSNPYCVTHRYGVVRGRLIPPSEIEVYKRVDTNIVRMGH